MADGNQSAATDKADELDITSMSLLERLAYVRDHSSGVGKEDIEMSFKDKQGGRQSVTIQGHTIGGVLAGIRPLLSEYRLFCLPSLTERTYSGNRCDVLVEFEWINIDKPEDRVTIKWAGADTDNAGKGFAKAATNALKEHLKKLFLVTDREDAKEETEQTEHQTDEGVSRREVDAARDKVRATFEGRARTYQAALESAGSAKAIKALKRDNADFLSDVELPSVTREHFEKLFKKRLAELEEVEANEAKEGAAE